MLVTQTQHWSVPLPWIRSTISNSTVHKLSVRRPNKLTMLSLCGSYELRKAAWQVAGGANVILKEPCHKTEQESKLYGEISKLRDPVEKDKYAFSKKIQAGQI
jgi:hypothetical protein